MDFSIKIVLLKINASLNHKLASRIFSGKISKCWISKCVPKSVRNTLGLGLVCMCVCVLCVWRLRILRNIQPAIFFGQPCAFTIETKQQHIIQHTVNVECDTWMQSRIAESPRLVRLFFQLHSTKQLHSSYMWSIRHRMCVVDCIVNERWKYENKMDAKEMVICDMWASIGSAHVFFS